MFSATKSRWSTKIVGGVVAVGLGAALIVGAGAAHADGGGEGTPCTFNGNSYAEGTTLEVGGVNYNCINGNWTEGLTRVAPATPTWTPPNEMTALTGLKAEYHPTQPAVVPYGKSLTARSTIHFPH